MTSLKFGLAALMIAGGVATGFAQSSPPARPGTTDEQTPQKAPGESSSRKDSLQKEAPTSGDPGVGTRGMRGTDPNANDQKTK